MRKLQLILIISTIVLFITGCGSTYPEEEFDEAEAIGLILIEDEVQESPEPEETEQEPLDEENTSDMTSDQDSPKYVPSASEQISNKKLAGKYTSDNGNVYTVKFYSSPDDERVGKITVNHPKMNFKEKLEIVEAGPNAFQVYETQDYFVFNNTEKGYTLTFYKDGLFADITVKNKKSKKS